MGHSVAVTYTLHLVTRDAAGTVTEIPAIEWRAKARCNVPGYGKPNQANLAQFVACFEASTRQGGCNEQLGVQTVVTALIRHQANRSLVCSYANPAADQN